MALFYERKLTNKLRTMVMAKKASSSCWKKLFVVVSRHFKQTSQQLGHKDYFLEHYLFLPPDIKTYYFLAFFFHYLSFFLQTYNQVVQKNGSHILYFASLWHIHILTHRILQTMFKRNTSPSLADDWPIFVPWHSFLCIEPTADCNHGLRGQQTLGDRVQVL